jgi:hypothetical protein
MTATLRAGSAPGAFTARWQLDPIPGAQVRPAARVILAPRAMRMRVRSRSARHGAAAGRPASR